jgi:DNA-binding NtrC family response regulator
MNPKVLLIDDEKEFIETLSERMQTRELDVSTATSAAEALGLIGQKNFDAIVVDLMMPGMDGIQTLKAIKANHPELQVILLTGHGSLEKGIEAMKLGAMDFLEKPADIDKLTEKIKTAQSNTMVIVEKQLEEKMKHIMNVKGW